jgi:predicted nuclease of predicted toxin-antitoxin system
MQLTLQRSNYLRSNNLALRFLLDMGISYKVARWLNTNGHDAVHLNDESLYQLPDNLILEKAIVENRIILTADMDFGHILAFTKTTAVSVIQFRISDLSIENIVPKLLIVFENYQEELQAFSTIITIQEHKIRFKTLPI